MAVEGVPQEHVATAARRFIRGEVMRERSAFLPSSADFAKECRRIMNEHDAARYVPLPAPPKPKEDPAMRAEVAAMFAELVRTIGPRPGKPDATVTEMDDAELRVDPVRVTNASALIQALEKRGV